MGERVLAEKNQLVSKKKVSWHAKKKNLDLQNVNLQRKTH